MSNEEPRMMIGVLSALPECGFFCSSQLLRSYPCDDTRMAEEFEDGPLGFCLDSEDEDLSEGAPGQIDEQARATAMTLEVERADILKATRLLKRLAKAWIWNRKVDLQGCLRQCRGIKKSKRVLAASGIFSFIIYKADAIAPLVGYDYAKQLDAIGQEWRKIVRTEDIGVVAGGPLGGHFATLPHTFKKRCEDIVEGLRLEDGSEAGCALLQKIAMALVARGF